MLSANLVVKCSQPEGLLRHLEISGAAGSHHCSLPTQLSGVSEPSGSIEIRI